jgi:hybrid cluster-associated redox disulfide protein
MQETTITPNLLLADIMARWPQTVRVFIKYRFSCVGCYLSPFDTLGEALQIYDVPAEKFIAELNQVAQVDTRPGDQKSVEP